MSANTVSPIIVAFDMQSLSDVEALAEHLDPTLCRAKIGKELFTACGTKAIEVLHGRGFEIFLDLKFHDIPNTVAKAVEAAANHNVWMVNVHAMGGQRMMAAAREAIDKISASTLLIAVTLLTSMEADELKALGVERTLQDQVRALALMARQQGLDGVVCSAQEAVMLRAAIESDFLLVTPGIRPAQAEADDQRRICTPAEALRNGSNYLVIGRPITQASDPALALAAIHQSLSGGDD